MDGTKKTRDVIRAPRVSGPECNIRFETQRSAEIPVSPQYVQREGPLPRPAVSSAIMTSPSKVRT